MVMNLDTGILLHDAATKNILWANPAACRMFGFSVEELRPLKAHHMSAQERAYRRSVGVSWLQDAVDNGTSWKLWKYRTKAGEDFLTSARAILISFGDHPVIMVHFRTVQPEDMLQQDLEKAQHYLKRIMTYASAGIILLDEEYLVADVSTYAAALLFQTPQELVGRSLLDLAEVTHRGRRFTLTGDLVEDSEPIDLRLRLRDPGQDAHHDRWLSGMLERVSHDGIASNILVLRDVTNSVRMEAENARQAASLQHLSRTNAMGDMAMVIAHELGQPLASAANYLTGLSSRHAAGKLTDEMVAYGLEQADRQLDRAASIVSSVRRYVARIESVEQDLDLNDVISDAMYFVGLKATERSVELALALSNEPLRMRGEPILLGQVVINLALNAVQESAQNGRVVVHSYRHGDTVCCAVTDFGRGLSGASAGKLTSGVFTDKQDGSGIGLLLSQRIVERHGGTLTLADNRPAGATATVVLPASAG
ncbi:MAG: ATP-binding protein [Actinomycetales bacterium]